MNLLFQNHNQNLSYTPQRNPFELTQNRSNIVTDTVTIKSKQGTQILKALSTRVYRVTISSLLNGKYLIFSYENFSRRL